MAEQYSGLTVEPGDKDSVARYLASLKSELAKEKPAREKAQAEAETLAQAVGNLKKTIDKFTAQVLVLEEKVLDRLNELRAKELAME
jgi:hypothetical protein